MNHKISSHLSELCKVCQTDRWPVQLNKTQIKNSPDSVTEQGSSSCPKSIMISGMLSFDVSFHRSDGIVCVNMHRSLNFVRITLLYQWSTHFDIRRSLVSILAAPDCSFVRCWAFEVKVTVFQTKPYKLRSWLCVSMIKNPHF